MTDSPTSTEAVVGPAMGRYRPGRPSGSLRKHLKHGRTTGPDIYELKPIRQGGYEDQTERERKLSIDVRLYGELPDDAEEGEVYTAWELLPDGHQTSEQRDQDALDEAQETGEEVIITSATIGCNDDNRDCTLDHVSRVATPEGEIEKRRTRTY